MKATLNPYCNTLPYELVAFSYVFLKPAERINPLMNTTEREILDSVSEILNLPIRGITGQSRIAKYAEARHIAIYLTKKLNPKITLLKLGKLYNRHHSTIIHTLSSVEGSIYIDPKYKKKVAQIEEKIKHLKATYAS